MVDKIVTQAQFDAMRTQQATMLADWYNSLQNVPTTPTTPPADSGFPSGLRIRSGVNPQWQGSGNVELFEQMRGRKVDVIVIHPARDNWHEINADWAYTEPIPAGFVAGGGKLVWSMPLWPGNGAVGTNYTTQWTAWANRIKALDPKSDVRLGWEMNLPNPWHVNASNRTAWVAAFLRAANAIKAAAPNVTITFNPNWGGDQTGVDCVAVFDQVKQVVDNYGIDYYDAWEPVLTAAQATARLNAYRSLVESYNIAKSRGKKFCIPEWAVAANGSNSQWAGHAGGDNPRYIDHVLGFLASLPAADVAYEAYFDEPDTYISSNLRPPTVNPLAAARYRSTLATLV